MTVRIDEYIAPTSFEDLNMDWPDPDPTDCKYVDAIVQAISQRLQGPAPSGYPVSLPVILPDMRMTTAKLRTIHNLTFALWSGNLNQSVRYLNCDEPVTNRTIVKSASSIYWEGTYNWNICDLNYWTDETIIAAIGDDAIVYPQPDVRDNKAWLIQQYKLLNKCNTHVISLSKIFNAYYKRKIYDISNGTVYNDSETDWLPVNWSSEDKQAYKYAYYTNSNTYSHDVQALKFTWSNRVPYPYDIDLLGAIEKYYPRNTSLEYQYPPGLFGVDSVQTWFNQFSAHIPANTYPMIDSQDGDMAFLSSPPQEDRYKDGPASWAWGGRRVSRDEYYGYPKVIGKFNFDFQAEES